MFFKALSVILPPPLANGFRLPLHPAFPMAMGQARETQATPGWEMERKKGQSFLDHKGEQIHHLSSHEPKVSEANKCLIYIMINTAQLFLKICGGKDIWEKNPFDGSFKVERKHHLSAFCLIKSLPVPAKIEYFGHFHLCSCFPVRNPGWGELIKIFEKFGTRL